MTDTTTTNLPGTLIFATYAEGHELMVRKERPAAGGRAAAWDYYVYFNRATVYGPYQTPNLSHRKLWDLGYRGRDIKHSTTDPITVADLADEIGTTPDQVRAALEDLYGHEGADNLEMGGGQADEVVTWYDQQVSGAEAHEEQRGDWSATHTGADYR